MSIIQEALKKAEKVNAPSREGVAAQVTTTAEAESADEKIIENIPAGNNRVRLAIYALIFAAGAALFLMNHNTAAFRKPSAPGTSAPKVVENSERPSVPATNISWNQKAGMLEPVKKLFDSQEGLTLSGIMHLEDGPRAIINDSMVAEGDTVGGANVMRITDSQVIIKKSDSEITLTLKP